jgi:hypothetical protein
MRNILHGAIAAAARTAAGETWRVRPQDFARLHGYDIVATSIVADPSLPHAWNKIGWLLRAYRVRCCPGSSLGVPTSVPQRGARPGGQAALQTPGGGAGRGTCKGQRRKHAKDVATLINQ